MEFTRKCSCPIKPNMTFDDLKQIILDKKMCTEEAMYICPNLDRELRKADAERDRRKYYNRRLKQQGFTDEQINSMPRRKRGAGRTFESAEVDFDF